MKKHIMKGLAIAAVLVLSVSAASAANISRDEAKVIAFNHAGVTEAQVTRLTIQYDMDDGRPEYEVEFYVGNLEYDYDICVATGRILSFEVETKGQGAGNIVTPPPTTGGTTLPATPAGASITPTEAKTIALNHAGVTEDQTTRMKVKVDRDDGRIEYEVEFYVGNLEYEYDISASNGRILSFEVERKGGGGGTTAGKTSTSSISAVYDGIVTDSEGTMRGTVTLTTKGVVRSNAQWATTNWTFTAKAILQTATVSFKATGWAGSEGNLFFTARTGEILDVHVEDGRLFGTLEGGRINGVLTVEGSRNPFTKSMDAEAQALLSKVRGYYTVALVENAADAAAALPAGYLTLNVGNQGAVKIAGKLADGTAVSASSKLLEATTNDGQLMIPLHKSLYAKKGLIGGVLRLNPQDSAIRAGLTDGQTVYWANEKSGSVFARKLDTVGGGYNAGLARASLVAFSADVPGDLPSPASQLDGTWDDVAFPVALPLSDAGTKLALRKMDIPSRAALTYTAQTGVFKGTFKLYYDGYNARGALQRKTVNVPFAGVVTPVRDNAFASLPVGLGTGTASINRQKFSIPVALD